MRTQYTQLLSRAVFFRFVLRERYRRHVVAVHGRWKCFVEGEILIVHNFLNTHFRRVWCIYSLSVHDNE